MVRKQFGGGAVGTTLNGSITNVATTATLTDGSTYPDGSVGPFVLVIDPETASEEKVLVTSRSTHALSGLTRGYDGTSAVSHTTGAVVRHVFDADTANEANAHVNDDARDDHSQYHTAARHAAVSHTGVMLAAALPQGSLNYAQVTSSQASITTEVDLTGLSVAVTAGTGRRLKISFGIGYHVNAEDNYVQCFIKEGATYLRGVRRCSDVTANPQTFDGHVIVTPSAGAHTYKLAFARVGGAGTVTMYADADEPAYILVEDIGSA